MRARSPSVIALAALFILPAPAYAEDQVKVAEQLLDSAFACPVLSSGTTYGVKQTTRTNTTFSGTGGGFSVYEDSRLLFSDGFDFGWDHSPMEAHRRGTVGAKYRDLQRTAIEKETEGTFLTVFCREEKSCVKVQVKRDFGPMEDRDDRGPEPQMSFQFCDDATLQNAKAAFDALISLGSQTSSASDDRLSTPRWMHNGSVVKLVAEGAKREFYYETPREGLTKAGVTSGALLFSGQRSGKTYSGTAYIFNKRCGPIAYQVSGNVSDDDRQVTMEGQAPRVGANCQVVTTKPDTLIFSYEENK
jgi:hypothetical protein